MHRKSKIGLVLCLLAAAFGIWALVLMNKTPEERFREWTHHRWVYRNAFAIAGVSADEYERCLEWAFGEGVESIKESLWPDRWNKRHPEKFAIIGTDHIQLSLVAVGQAWCKLEKYYWGYRDGDMMVYDVDGVIISDCNFYERN